MKKLYTIIFSLITFIQINGQVLISPYIVYTDQQNKFGTFLVQNESDEIYEISVSFIFGYPVSDSIGQLSMRYIEQDSSEYYSIAQTLRAFPRKFLLNPKQRQVVRMTVKTPDTLAAGTYWSRIVTSAAPHTIPTDTVNKGITARIKFVLNQVTTVLYRVEPAETGINIKNVIVSVDSNQLKVISAFERTGNSPFFGNLFVKIIDSTQNVVEEKKEFMSVYFDLVKNVDFDLTKFKSGKFKAEIQIVLNEKEDIPESNFKPIEPIFRTVEFEIP